MVVPALKWGHVALVCISSSLFLTFQITSSSVTALFKSFTFVLKATPPYPVSSVMAEVLASLAGSALNTSQGADILPTPSGLKFSTLPTCLFSQRSHFIFT